MTIALYNHGDPDFICSGEDGQARTVEHASTDLSYSGQPNQGKNTSCQPWYCTLVRHHQSYDQIVWQIVNSS